MSRADAEGQPLATVTVSLPVTVELDGCSVTLLESKRYTLTDRTRYIVSCQAVCRGIKSPIFFVDVSSNTELIWKLKAELAKFKLILML